MRSQQTDCAWDAAWAVVGLVPGDPTSEQRRALFHAVYEPILAAIQRYEWLRARERPRGQGGTR
ncbi:MAG: hypothetical protein U0871_04785 [Gemmataceae bacterium]